MERELKIGRYKHFKGKDKVYEVIGEAIHTETEEILVIYKEYNCNNKNEFKMFARPQKMFLEEVPEDKENPTGQKYRFEYEGEI